MTSNNMAGYKWTTTSSGTSVIWTRDYIHGCIRLLFAKFLTHTFTYRSTM